MRKLFAGKRQNPRISKIILIATFCWPFIKQQVLQFPIQQDKHFGELFKRTLSHTTTIEGNAQHCILYFIDESARVGSKMLSICQHSWIQFIGKFRERWLGAWCKNHSIKKFVFDCHRYLIQLKYRLKAQIDDIQKERCSKWSYWMTHNLSLSINFKFIKMIPNLAWPYIIPSTSSAEDKLNVTLTHICYLCVGSEVKINSNWFSSSLFSHQMIEACECKTKEIEKAKRMKKERLRKKPDAERRALRSYSIVAL